MPTTRITDKQKPTKREQVREQRPDWIGNPVTGIPWGQPLWPWGVASDVEEGTPGSFTPLKAVPPDLATLITWDPTPDPGTAWTGYIVLGDGSPARWDGGEWILHEATGATQGTPGAFTPAGVVLPDDLAALIALDPAASPGTAWTGYVVLGDGSRARWDGSDWIEHTSTGATAGEPGAFTPAHARIPADYAELVSLDPTADPATAWTEGQHVVLGDESAAYWDGNSWEEGEAPA